MACVREPNFRPYQYGRVLPKGKGRPIWATEIWWDSKPPDPKGVPEAKHARWLSKSFYELWKQGVERVQQSGLYLLDGKPRLAQRAFAFPFVAERQKSGSVRLWGVAPSQGSVVIERKTGSGWKRVATATASSERARAVRAASFTG